MVMDISFPGRSMSRSPWHFNPSLLSGSDFINTINSRIDLFISTNVKPDVSAATIWESCKAYLRGEIISYSAYQRKIAVENKVSLSKDIAELQSKCINTPNADLLKQLLMKKAKYDILASKETAQSLLRACHNYYEFEDKPSKLLAHQIQQASTSRHITQINTDIGPTINPQSINNQFKHFYASPLNTHTMKHNTNTFLTP